MSILKFQMMLFAFTRLHEEAIQLDQQYPGKWGGNANSVPAQEFD